MHSRTPVALVCQTNTTDFFSTLFIYLMYLVPRPQGGLYKVQNKKMQIPWNINFYGAPS